MGLFYYLFFLCLVQGSVVFANFCRLYTQNVKKNSNFDHKILNINLREHLFFCPELHENQKNGHLEAEAADDLIENFLMTNISRVFVPSTVDSAADGDSEQKTAGTESSGGRQWSSLKSSSSLPPPPDDERERTKSLPSYPLNTHGTSFFSVYAKVPKRKFPSHCYLSFCFSENFVSGGLRLR